MNEFRLIIQVNPSNESDERVIFTEEFDAAVTDYLYPGYTLVLDRKVTFGADDGYERIDMFPYETDLRRVD